MVATFCNKLGWGNLEILISQFQSRLEFGVQRELVGLMAISTMTSSIARKLYKNGFEAVAAVARANKEEIEKIIASDMAFDHVSPGKSKANARLIWVESKRQCMTPREIAQEIVDEARRLQEAEIGRPIDWDDLPDSQTELLPAKVTTKQKHVRKMKEKRLAKKKSPQKVINMAKFAKIRPDIRKQVSRTSLGEHSISLDNSVIEMESSQYSQDSQESEAAAQSVENSQDAAGDESDAVVAESSEESDSSDKGDAMPSKDDKTPSTSKSLFSSSSQLHQSSAKRKTSTPTTPEISRRKKIAKNLNRSFDDTDAADVVPESPHSEANEHESPPEVKPDMQPEVPERSQRLVSDDFVVNKIAVTGEAELTTLRDTLSTHQRVSIVFDCEPFKQPTLKRIGFLRGAKNEQQDTAGLLFNNGQLMVTRIAFGFPDSSAFVIEDKDTLIALRNSLKLSRTTVIVFGAKRTYRVLRECFDVDKETLTQLRWFDVSTAHWMMNPDLPNDSRPHTIHDLVQVYTPELAAVSKRKRHSSSFKATLLFPLHDKLRNVLHELELLHSFENVESPVLLIFAEIELIGMGVDKKALEEQRERWTELRDRLEDQAKKLANKPSLDVRSPKQVAKLLYTDLKLLTKAAHLIDTNPIRQEELRKSGAIAKHLTTSKEMLDKLRQVHPLPGVISDCRTVDRILNNTIANMREHMFHCDEFKMSRVTGEIDTMLATGRIAMDNANLLAIPRDTTVTIGDDVIPISVRKLFVPQSGNYKFLEFFVIINDNVIILHSQVTFYCLLTIRSSSYAFSLISARTTS